MSVGALIKKSFTSAKEIFVKNLLPVFMAVVLILIPLWAVDFFIVERLCDFDEIQTHFEEYAEQAASDENVETVPAQIRSDLRKLFFYFLLKVVLNIMQLLLICCMAILTKKRTENQGRTNIMEVMEEAAYSYPKTVLSYLIVLALTVCGLFFFIFPGVIIYLGLMFALPGTSLRRKTGPSLLDSIRVFREKPWASVLIFLISFMAPFAVDMLLSVILGFLANYEIIYGIVSCVFFMISGMASCFGYILVTVFYLDRTTLPLAEKKPE